MWEPRRLTTVWAFMAPYRDSFTFTYRAQNVPVFKSTHSEHTVCNIVMADILIGCGPPTTLQTLSSFLQLLSSLSRRSPNNAPPLCEPPYHYVIGAHCVRHPHSHHSRPLLQSCSFLEIGIRTVPQIVWDYIHFTNTQRNNRLHGTECVWRSW
jgi:hypothetical protein